ncbi:MAG: THxN family PEP-CTERM protein [Cyanobacteria bacterium J06592_8]
MFSKPAVNLLLTPVLTSALAFVGAGANAITLNGSSGTWSNPVGGSFIEFQTVGEENQIRWGDAVIPGQPSGLGFTGVETTEVELENVFQIGTLRHFNNTIFGDTAASAVDLSIDLDFTEFGVRSFDFSFEIDETTNQGEAENCPYPSLTPCSDRISFPVAFAPQSFDIDDVSYTLSLEGFSSAVDQSILSDFISDESQTSEALLFGKITAVANIGQPDATVPEPQTIAGLFAVGSIFASRLLKRDWLK